MHTESPLPPTPAEKPQKKRLSRKQRKRLARRTATWAPIGISLLALVLSLFAFVDQRRQDATAASVAHRADAGLVDVFRDRSDANDLVVTNLSLHPVTGLFYAFGMFSNYPAPPDGIKLAPRAYLGTIDQIPACSGIQVDLRSQDASWEGQLTSEEQLRVKRFKIRLIWEVLPIAFGFSNRDGVWESNTNGILEQLPLKDGDLPITESLIVQQARPDPYSPTPQYPEHDIPVQGCT